MTRTFGFKGIHYKFFSKAVSFPSNLVEFYLVEEAFDVTCEEYKVLNKPPGAEDPEFIGVVTNKTRFDGFLNPDSDPLLCFPPQVGVGKYESMLRIPMILWRGECWVPIISCKPDRTDMAEAFGYGDPYKKLDVLYRVQVDTIPDILDILSGTGAWRWDD